MANGSNNARFLSKIDSKSKSMILENIAKHYGISTQEAFSEVTDSEAEHLLDYMTEPARSAASILMQKHGLRGFSRPGAPDTFAVEDRFYFGKGRKERFEDDRLAKFLEVYNRNEDNNYHSENVLLLAKFLGNTDDVKKAQQIVNQHKASSTGISDELYKERTDLNRRLLSKFRSRYPQASI